MPQNRPTQNQFEILISFLEKNNDVLYPSDHTIASKRKYNIAWDILTEVLNSDCSGPTKSVDKWKKTLRDWKQYVKMKADRISSSLNCSDGSLPTETLKPLEERLASLLGHTFEDKNGKVISSPSNNDGKSKPSSSSLKRILEDEEYEEEFEDSESLLNLKNFEIQKIFNNYQKKRKKQKSSRKDEDESSEIFIEENEDRRMQARLVEAEEQKADALQRLASSFESIATSVEFLCHSLLQKK